MGAEPVEVRPPELDLIPGAKIRTLESLNEEFGDRLRIAVEPTAIYTAITGSHIRVSFSSFSLVNHDLTSVA